MKHPCGWTLIGQTPVPCYDVLDFVQWFSNIKNRRVARTHLAGGYEVSTVFLGLDCFGGFADPPLLFETLVSTPKGPSSTRKCASWSEAEAQHKQIVAGLRQQIKKEKAGQYKKSRRKIKTDANSTQSFRDE